MKLPVRSVSLNETTNPRMDVAYSNAERLILTELNAVETRASADAMKAADFDYYQFVATLDRRTCPICGERDGEVYPLSSMNQGENAPPMHPRCRCTIVASIDDGKQGRKTTDQRAAEGRTRVPADMSYRDWRAVYVDKSKTLAQWQAEQAALKKLSADGLVEQHRLLSEKSAASYKEYRTLEEKIYRAGDTAERKRLYAEQDAARQSYLEAQERLKYIRVQAAKNDVILTSGLSQSGYSADQIAEIVAKVRTAPQDFRTLWNLAEDAMKVVDTNFNGTPGYDPIERNIKLNLYKDIHDKAQKPYKTTLHEVGHAVAHFMGDYMYDYSVAYKGGLFGDTLRAEAQERVAATLMKLKREAVAAGKSAKGIKLSDAYGELSKELQGLEHLDRREVSDIWSGATKNKVAGGYKHETKYWKDADTLPQEAFAHMFGATIQNPEALANIKAYFPKSYRVFEEMVSDYVKGATP